MSFPLLNQEIDIQALLKPISESNRAGESLRYEGTYDRITDARREDDPTLSQGIYKFKLKRADWTTVESVCSEALTTRTKDLQVAAWLLEAWMHLYGVAGVAAGLNLLAGLSEEFWDEAHPTMADGDLDARLAIFDWIDQKLTLKLKQIPLTLTDDSGDDSYTYADWESACHFENLALKDPAALREALTKIRPTVTAFRTAIMSTDRSFYLDFLESLDHSLDACVSLEQVLESRCGDVAPRLRQFKEVLAEIRQLITHGLSSGDEIIEEDPEAVESERSEAEVEFWSSGPIRGRADAYRRLSEIAEYLLKTEPHSP